MPVPTATVAPMLRRAHLAAPLWVPAIIPRVDRVHPAVAVPVAQRPIVRVGRTPVDGVGQTVTIAIPQRPRLSASGVRGGAKS